MYVLSLDFDQKVEMINLLYSNFMEYNILYMVTKFSLLIMNYMVKKAEKCKKHIF